MPLIPTFPTAGRPSVDENQIVSIEWESTGKTMLRLALNLSGTVKPAAMTIEGQVIWAEGEWDAMTLGAWSAIWSIEELA